MGNAAVDGDAVSVVAGHVVVAEEEPTTAEHGHRQGMTGPVAYWEVDDIEKSLTSLLTAGAEALQEVRDVGGGKLIASVKDADRNILGLMQSP